LKNLEKYKPEVPFKMWIRRVMINVLIDEFRKQKRHKDTIEYVGEYYESGNNSNENAVISKMNVEQIHALIVQLPPMSQKVFNLYVIDGFSHKEIADLLKMSEGTSKWHLNLSRTRLKDMLSKIILPVEAK
jgi:RNA polymerase sigma-70 factor (ECF subfamily)